MTIPTIQVVDSANIDQAISLLRELEVNCRNQAQPASNEPPYLRQATYVRYATITEQRLRSIMSVEDAIALFGGPRHRDICSMTPGVQLDMLIAAEVDAQAHKFGALAKELQEARQLFANDAKCIVLDSTFYIEHSEKLEDVDFHQLVGSSGPVRVLVPMVVIDELDGLKRNGDKFKRWRAGYSLAVIDRVIVAPPTPGILTPKVTNPPRGEVTLQIVFDTPDHVRLPIADDEIVDRAVACQPYTGPITMVTYDTGQAQRARMARLNLLKLRNDPPDPSSDTA